MKWIFYEITEHRTVADSLTDMLSGSMKQIIMISHRELERIDNVIEV